MTQSRRCGAPTSCRAMSVWSRTRDMIAHASSVLRLNRIKVFPVTDEDTWVNPDADRSSAEGAVARRASHPAAGRLAAPHRASPEYAAGRGRGHHDDPGPCETCHGGCGASALMADGERHHRRSSATKTVCWASSPSRMSSPRSCAIGSTLKTSKRVAAR
jgi:hypothetical protein